MHDRTGTLSVRPVTALVRSGSTRRRETYRILSIAVSALPMLGRKDRTGNDVSKAEQGRDVANYLAH